MSEDVTPSIAELHAGKADAKAWFGLAVLGLPTLLVAIDMTVLHLAVPAITASIAPSPVEMLWIVDIYGFMIAGLLVTMGTLGDRLGRRRLLMVGSTSARRPPSRHSRRRPKFSSWHARCSASRPPR